MHRRSRCLFVLPALLGTLLATLPRAAAAQADTPVDAAPHAAPAHTAPARAARHHRARPSAPAVTGRLAARVRLGDGLRTYSPSRHQLGVRYAPGVTDRTPGPQVRFVVDRATLRRYLTGLAPLVRRHPADARPVVAVSNADDGAQQVPARVVPGHSGAVLEVDAAVDGVQKAIQTAPATLHVVLPVKVKPAQVSAQDLQGVNARIGYFVTHFNPGDAGRTMTVRHAIDLINGTVVGPGATFSVNKVVGERTPQNGFYGKGHVFVDGKMEVQAGGGMCQVATTLFNAVMLADLKVTERHQHVRTIPYAPPGSDATIYWGQKDFKFANDTGAPVYVSYRTTETHAIVALFGKGVPGRKVKIIRHSAQLAERHFTGSISRVVYEPGSAVQRGPTFHSDYKWTPALDFSR